MFGPLSLDITFFTSSQLSFTKVRNPEALGSGFTFQSVLIPLAQLFFKFFTHDLSPVCQSMSKVSGLSRSKVSGNTIQTHGQCDNGQSSRSAWTLVTWVKIRITLGPAKSTAYTTGQSQPKLAAAKLGPAKSTAYTTGQSQPKLAAAKFCPAKTGLQPTQQFGQSQPKLLHCRCHLTVLLLPNPLADPLQADPRAQALEEAQALHSHSKQAQWAS